MPDDGLAAEAAGESSRPLSLLAEADPALWRALGEVMQDLEDTLRLLDEVLDTGVPEQAFHSDTGPDPSPGDSG